MSISSAMATGNPYPANPDGSQAQGTDCNKIPSNLIDKSARP
jgi:hypothetical protein